MGINCVLRDQFWQMDIDQMFESSLYRCFRYSFYTTLAMSSSPYSDRDLSQSCQSEAYAANSLLGRQKESSDDLWMHLNKHHHNCFDIGNQQDPSSEHQCCKQISQNQHSNFIPAANQEPSQKKEDYLATPGMLGNPEQTLMFGCVFGPSQNDHEVRVIKKQDISPKDSRRFYKRFTSKRAKCNVKQKTPSSKNKPTQINRTVIKAYLSPQFNRKVQYIHQALGIVDSKAAKHYCSPYQNHLIGLRACLSLINYCEGDFDSILYKKALFIFEKWFLRRRFLIVALRNSRTHDIAECIRYKNKFLQVTSHQQRQGLHSS